jgi:hypothetical protein
MSERNKIIKANCPSCDGERNCQVHSHILKEWDWSDNFGNSVNGGDNHSLLECCGCETIFYEISSWNSESIDYGYDAKGDSVQNYHKDKATYPKPESKRKPLWFDGIAKVDIQLSNILAEMYVAYDSESYILTAVGLRTALDRATEVLKIDPAISFEEKLTSLKNDGLIGEAEMEVLSVVTDAGNAAAHRGWTPDAMQVSHLITAMEVFLQRAIIVGKEALKIKDKIPPKPKRKKKT